MNREYAKPIEHIEYDHEFARRYRQRMFRPFFIAFCSILSFVFDVFISNLVGKQPGFGQIVGVLLAGVAFFSLFWQEFGMKRSYRCRACEIHLPFSEPDTESEIRYYCRQCGIEYRVRTDGNYDFETSDRDSD